MTDRDAQIKKLINQIADLTGGNYSRSLTGMFQLDDNESHGCFDTEFRQKDPSVLEGNELLDYKISVTRRLAHMLGTIQERQLVG